MNPTKDIRPYLHLYLGVPVKIWFADENGDKTVERKGRLSWNHEEDCEWVIWHLDEDDEHDSFDEIEFDFKPILRRLSSMSEDEKIKLYDDWYPSQSNEVGRDQKINFVTNILSPKGVYTESNVSFIDFVPIIPHLLLRGFWLFGDDWFDEGIIIDADALK